MTKSTIGSKFRSIIVLLLFGGGCVFSPTGSAAVLGPDTYPIQLPADSPSSVTLGSVTISTYSPVTITPFENSTNVYFDVRNNAAQRRTIEFTSWDELVQTHPSWLYHLFRLFGTEERGPFAVTLDPGQTRTLEFYVSKDVAGGEPLQVTLPFRFRVVEDSQQGSLDVTFIADDRIMQLYRTKTASIEGRITDAAGKPIVGAIVSAGALGLNLFGVAQAGPDGRYKIEVTSAADTRTILGHRRLPYRSLDYFVTVEADGYAMAYRDGIAPPTNQAATVDVALQARASQAGYRLVGELKTDGQLAYWWIRFAGSNNDRVVSIQGQHPPVDPKTPAHIIGADLSGRELWRVPTGGECWGIDVSPDGRLIAVGCHDSNVYVVTQDGELRYKQALGDRPDATWPTSHVADVRFSPDGTKLLVDGGGGQLGFTVLEAATGQFLWRSKPSAPGNAPLTAYKARWTSDSRRVVAGGNGPIAMFTADGTFLWENQMGESPLWLEVDDAYNSYAAGKSRELFSWDKDGKLRWRYRLAHTSNEAWKGITADGSFMLMPTFNGILQSLDSAGNVVWQRRAAAPTPTAAVDPLTLSGTGHNGLSMTPGAERIALGTRDWQVQVYARDGTLLWHDVSAMRSDFKGENPEVHGHITGTTAVAISPDGKYIAAGYADSVIRIFSGEAVVAPANYQGLWWNPNESGWGINFAHQGDTIFATWFTYDRDGKPWWLISSLKQSGSSYAGELFTVSGQPFNSEPWLQSKMKATAVGSMTVTFGSTSKGSVNYTVNGVSQTKAIEKQLWGTAPTCVWGGQSDLTKATNYTDIWWNASESGWGINLTEQSKIIYATWFTYDAEGSPWWLVSTMKPDASGSVYSGDISTIAGPPFSAVPWDPSRIKATNVGTMNARFSDGNHANLTYTVNGITQTKAVTRQVFALPGTACADR